MNSKLTAQVSSSGALLVSNFLFPLAKYVRVIVSLQLNMSTNRNNLACHMTKTYCHSKQSVCWNRNGNGNEKDVSQVILCLFPSDCSLYSTLWCLVDGKVFETLENLT